MQREYKFRGKVINHAKAGDWVYGSLIQEPTRSRIFVAHSDVHSEMYEVDSKTVGQFTGYYAAKGQTKTELYESDFCDSRMTLRPCEVFNKYGCWMFGLDALDMYKGTLKLIGNRWDNPELLSSNEKE